MTAILIGCDPEVFVKQENIFKSAFGLIKGTKANPFRVKRGAVQVDGMALEFNIDPAKSEDEFCINVQDVFAQMKKMVPQYDVVVSPVADFDPAYMKQQPKEALELGCDPDFNAWMFGVVNEKPDGDRSFRTAAGHVHIGWTKNQDIGEYNHLELVQRVIRQMDFYLGLGSLFYDDDVKRREMYGKAGCYRPKEYGCEYRTLSNMWLNSEKLMRWVYRNAVKGTNDLFAGNELALKYGDISEIINTSNRGEALAIIQTAGLELPNV